MKVFTKVKCVKDNKNISKYKFLGVTIIRRENSTRRKRWYVGAIKLASFKCRQKHVRCIEKCNEKFPSAKQIRTGRIAIIAELSIPQCTLYRVTNKIKVLEDMGYVVDIEAWPNINSCMEILQNVELAIFYRVPFVDSVKKMYAECDRLGIPKIYDIDDCIFDEKIYKKYLKNLPVPESVKQGCIDGISLYNKALFSANAFFTTTKKLAQICKDKIKTFIVPNCIPNNLLDAMGYRANKSDKTVKIFYGSGSNTHDTDFDACISALEQALIKYDNVELFIHGYLNTDKFSEKIKHKIHKMDFINASDYYFAISDYDISLAPLEDNDFSDAKSNIKYIESSVLSIPCIVSNRQEFADVITNGVDGFIAKKAADWQKCLFELIEKPDLRKKMAQKARENVMKLYSDEQNTKYMRNALKEFLPKTKQGKKKILFVNILYGHSSFGGATIVAEQISEEFNKFSDYEPFVFSCHVSNDSSDMVRYDWNGVPVFSVNIPGVSWDYNNDEIKNKFLSVLNIIQPDLVHFHCIQKMGIGLMKACKQENIPYTLTIHDAWFVCPRQFMLDVNNQYCNQAKCCPEICKKRCCVSNADFFARKRAMCEVIKDAKYVCTPSKTFSEQMQNNFPFVKIGTNSNGIVRTNNHNKKSTSKEIVFGFFGGADEVKGYFFMKNILSEYYSDKPWKIVLIDTARKFNYVGIRETDWAENRAEILGYTPHEDMPKVFNKIDVLLFPSQWNESFGLMVREAIDSNCFIVCSECGGPKDAIKNYDNGIVFPKNDEAEFKKCLDWCFDNYDFIKNYKTTNFGDIRTFNEQAIELKNHFDSIIKKIG